MRKLAALLIDSVDEQTTEYLMLIEKLNLCEDENSALKSSIAELSVKIGILETSSLEPNEGLGTLRVKSESLVSLRRNWNKNLRFQTLSWSSFLKSMLN